MQARSYIGRHVSELPTPLLLLDLDALESNIGTLRSLTAAAGLACRPHAKGHKSIAIAKKQVIKDAVGICCQKLGEAEVFLAAGIADILITNEIVDQSKLARACELARSSRLI